MASIDSSSVLSSSNPSENSLLHACYDLDGDIEVDEIGVVHHYHAVAPTSHSNNYTDNNESSTDFVDNNNNSGSGEPSDDDDILFVPVLRNSRAILDSLLEEVESRASTSIGGRKRGNTTSSMGSNTSSHHHHNNVVLPINSNKDNIEPLKEPQPKAENLVRSNEDPPVQHPVSTTAVPSTTIPLAIVTTNNASIIKAETPVLPAVAPIPQRHSSASIKQALRSINPSRHGSRSSLAHDTAPRVSDSSLSINTGLELNLRRDSQEKSARHSMTLENIVPIDSTSISSKNTARPVSAVLPLKLPDINKLMESTIGKGSDPVISRAVENVSRMQRSHSMASNSSNHSNSSLHRAVRTSSALRRGSVIVLGDVNTTACSLNVDVKSRVITFENTQYSAPHLVDTDSQLNAQALYDVLLSDLVRKIQRFSGNYTIVTVNTDSASSQRDIFSQTFGELFLNQLVMVLTSEHDPLNAYLIRASVIASNRGRYFDLNSSALKEVPIGSRLDDLAELVLSSQKGVQSFFDDIRRCLETITKNEASENNDTATDVMLKVHLESTRKDLHGNVQCFECQVCFLDLLQYNDKHSHAPSPSFEVLTDFYVHSKAPVPYSLAAQVLSMQANVLFYAKIHRLNPQRDFIQKCCALANHVASLPCVESSLPAKPMTTRLEKYQAEIQEIRSNSKLTSQMIARIKDLEKRIISVKRLSSSALTPRLPDAGPPVTSRPTTTRACRVQSNNLLEVRAHQIDLSMSSIGSSVHSQPELPMIKIKPQEQPKSTDDLQLSIDTIVTQMLDPSSGVQPCITDASPPIFTGFAIVIWLSLNVADLSNESAARSFAQQLLESKQILSTNNISQFSGDASALYIFAKQEQALRMNPEIVDLKPTQQLNSIMEHPAITPVPAANDALNHNNHRKADFASSEPIHRAALMGPNRTAMLELVRQHGVDHADSNGRTPLMYAILGNQLKTCELLLKLKADVNAVDITGQSGLLWAASKGHADILKLLLKNGADVTFIDNEHRNAFHWSARLSNIKCLQLLGSCSVSAAVINQQDIELLTPLHWAVMCNNDQHARYLLKKLKADASLQDAEGRTALMYAVASRASESIDVLLRHCSTAVVGMGDTIGRTALHRACGDGQFDAVVRLIASKKCDINSKDNRLATPLLWATVTNRPELLQLLLENNAKPLLCDATGKTALQYALQMNFLECVKILKSHSNVPRGSVSNTGESIPESINSGDASQSGSDPQTTAIEVSGSHMERISSLPRLSKRSSCFCTDVVE